MRGNKRTGLAVNENSVADVVSDWTTYSGKTSDGRGSQQRLAASGKSTLHKRVIGQDEAVSAVAQAVRRGRVGLKDPYQSDRVFPVSWTDRCRQNRDFPKALAQEAVFGSGSRQ